MLYYFELTEIQKWAKVKEFFCHIVIDLQVSNGKTGEKVEISSFSEEKRKEFYKIHLKKNLEKATDYKLTIGHFIGEIATDLRGLYYSSYKDGNVVKWVVIP